MKLFLFDIETTGVKYWKNGIYQISGMIIIDDEIKEEFNFKVQPYKDAIIEDEALKVGNVTKEQIQNYKPFREVYNELTLMLSKYVDRFDKKDKFFLVGYNNASFDNQFLRAFFTQNNDNYFGSYFWANSIDVMVLASNKLKNEREKLENFQLKTVAKYLGIEIDETRLHDANYDILLTYRIYKIVE
jgi:DNA polymerase-3 subunit epsilon